MKRLLQLLILLSTLFATSAAAQRDTAAWLAAQTYADALKNGGLVVRLTSNHRKMQAMRALLDTGALNDQNRLRLRNELELTEVETRRQNREIMTAFRLKYNLSQVYFTYDTASVYLAAGRRNGYFLNDSLLTDPSIQLQEGPFLSLRVGYADAANYSGAEGLILGDAGLKDLQNRYFPTSAAFNNFVFFFNDWDPRTASQRRYLKAVKKLSIKLKIAISKLKDTD